VPSRGVVGSRDRLHTFSSGFGPPT
jgi:hypothetical protein